MSNTRRALGVVCAVALLALTGCGAVRPGVAVEVGDETISMSKVDEVSADFCAAVAPQLESQAETIPNGYFRGGIAGTLALRSAADQLAADYGVEADSEQYLQALADLKQGVAAVPEELRASVIEVDTAPQYVEAVQAAVGETLLDGEGEYADFVSAGTEELETWIAENGIEFDPALNTGIKDGMPAPEDTDLSFAVSEKAVDGQADEPNSVTARQLPATLRCGR